MKLIDIVRQRENRLDVVAGLIDGILSALALAAARLIKSTSDGISLNLAVRVSIAAGLTTVFVFFVAHYAELRLQLVRHEKQLNMTEHGRLAASRLGAQVFRESIEKALLASFFSLIGALFPLLCCVLIPTPGWISLAITISALGVLGAVLARTFYGSPIAWSLALMIFGAAMTLAGVELNLVGA